MVSEKTGLSEDVAQEAVELVVDYLKENLPDPIAKQIDNVLAGGGAAQGLDQLSKGLGNVLGKK
jgi:hypothetical protein